MVINNVHSLTDTGDGYAPTEHLGDDDSDTKGIAVVHNNNNNNEDTLPEENSESIKSKVKTADNRLSIFPPNQ